MKYNKLVRDKIPEIIIKNSKIPVTHKATEKEYIQKLREKLREEVEEYYKDNNKKELADILEVIYALSKTHNMTRDELEILRKKKADERGEFNERLILEETKEKEHNSAIAAKAFIIKENALLIVKRSSNEVQKPNIWEIPGGRLESNEDPIDGIKREVKEETGIGIKVLNPFSVRHFKREDGQTITMLIFLCKALTDEVKLGYEHSAFEWITIEKSKEKLAEFFHPEVDLFNKLELYKFIN